MVATSLLHVPTEVLVTHVLPAVSVFLRPSVHMFGHTNASGHGDASEANRWHRETGQLVCNQCVYRCIAWAHRYKEVFHRALELRRVCRRLREVIDTHMYGLWKLVVVNRLFLSRYPHVPIWRDLTATLQSKVFRATLQTMRTVVEAPAFRAAPATNALALAWAKTSSARGRTRIAAAKRAVVDSQQSLAVARRRVAELERELAHAETALPRVMEQHTSEMERAHAHVAQILERGAPTKRRRSVVPYVGALVRRSRTETSKRRRLRAPSTCDSEDESEDEQSVV